MRWPSSRAVGAVALVLLLTLAGCSGLSGDSTGTTTSSSTNYPPGVVDGSLDAPGLLLDAHQERLVASGFESNVVLNATIRQRQGDGGLKNVPVERRQQTLVESSGRPYQYRSVNADTGARFDVYGNASSEYLQAKYGGNTLYQRNDPAPADQLTWRRFLSRFLETSDYEVVNTGEQDGLQLYTMQATSTTNATRALTPRIDSVEDYRSTMVVDEQGRIHKLTVDATYVIGGERETYHFGFELIRIGGVETQKPDWVAEGF